MNQERKAGRPRVERIVDIGSATIMLCVVLGLLVSGMAASWQPFGALSPSGCLFAASLLAWPTIASMILRQRSGYGRARLPELLAGFVLISQLFAPVLVGSVASSVWAVKILGGAAIAAGAVAPFALMLDAAIELVRSRHNGSAPLGRVIAAFVAIFFLPVGIFLVHPRLIDACSSSEGSR
jgi:hypothetical protein